MKRFMATSLALGAGLTFASCGGETPVNENSQVVTVQQGIWDRIKEPADQVSGPDRNTDCYVFPNAELILNAGEVIYQSDTQRPKECANDDVLQMSPQKALSLGKVAAQ